jgi:hypothetical protein
MDSLKHSNIVLGFVATSLAVTLVGCKGKGSDVIAVINGESITREEYVQHLERKPNVLIQTNQGSVAANVAQPLNFQALNDVVNQRLLIQMAKDEALFPTNDEVTRELQHQLTKRPDFVKALTSEGLTMVQIKEQIRLDLCRYKLVTKGVTISDEAVDTYIKNNPDQFKNPKTVDLSWIVVKTPTAQAQVDTELRGNQTFIVVAKRHSLMREPMYPTRVYNSFPARLKQIVDKLPEGGTSEWLTDANQKVRFHVEKKTEASSIEIKPWMKVEIKRQLTMQKGSVAVDLDKRLLAKRKQAAITISQVGLKERFDQVQKSLKESDVQSGAKATDAKPTAK